jgi:hypothetical protein
MGICEVLIPLTNSSSMEVQGNSAAALGNLSSKAAEDYAPFNAVWNQPEGGLHAYLVRFLGSPDQTFQHIAVWVSPMGDLTAIQQLNVPLVVRPSYNSWKPKMRP